MLKLLPIKSLQLFEHAEEKLVLEFETYSSPLDVFCNDRTNHYLCIFRLMEQMLDKELLD